MIFVQALKLTGSIVAMFFCVVFGMIGVLCFVLGIFNHQPEAAILAFVVVALSIYVLKCLW